MVSVKIKVNLPKTKFATKKWLDGVASAQRTSTVPALRALFRKTVFGWKEKPDFGWSQTKSQDEIGITMYPRGPGADIWAMLNQGIPPHQIYPRKQGGMLRFQPGYRASTTPGSIMSKRAYRSGKPISVPHVNHPGVQARSFTQAIVFEYAMNFTKDMQKAINQAAKKK